MNHKPDILGTVYMIIATPYHVHDLLAPLPCSYACMCIFELYVMFHVYFLHLFFFLYI